ncbi:hypothetical protein K456DRAFT_1173866 [Colletotrichum gloeosporioides 23]|nr:hypothetical protein K456DRAFT_1173866 [Colletotrichum gloeosporioides 23]
MDGNIMTSYLNALHHGVSDSQYHLASARAPLSERLNRLVTCFELLLSRKFRSRRARYHDLLISSEWFENAARVKRRVLTQGGTDHSFFEDIQRFCGLSWEDTDLEKFFLHEKSTIGLEWPSPDHGPNSEPTYTSSVDAIKSVLSSYKDCTAGSWKRGLFEMKEDVARALRIPNVLNVEEDLPGVKVLSFTPRSTLWNRTVLLGAPRTT